MIITVDGPAGAGKSELAKRIANWLRFRCVASGVYYRAIALEGLDTGDPPDQIIHGLRHLNLEGERLRSKEVEKEVVVIAAIPKVREYVRNHIRKLAESEFGCVIDGRAGGVEYPEAVVKIFLSAEIDTRARRRFEQIKEAGGSPDFNQIKFDIAERDMRDQTREAAPLLPAPDARVIESDDFTRDQVFEMAQGIVLRRMRDAFLYEYKNLRIPNGGLIQK